MERRSAIELRAASNSLIGYAAVFDSPSHDLGGFVEFVRRTAFERTLSSSSNSDVVALVHHNPERILGRSSAGTLRLNTDNRGLAFHVDLPDTTAARDVLVGVERGDINGASFAFSIPEGGDRWTRSDDGAIRELLDVDLHDITVTAMPAYTDTSVAKRALAAFQPIRLQLANRYLETV